MKKLLHKLVSKKGESLVESLAAILIFTMASIVLFSMVTTAGDLNRKTKELDQQVQTQLVSIERGDPTYRTGTDTVTMTLPGGQLIARIDVDIYGGQDDSLYAYFVKIGGGS